MKPFEIWSYQPAGWPQPHPAVIISSAGRVSNKPDVNVLMCTSQASTRQPAPNEVILDESDGLSWSTLCKCDLIHMVVKSNLKNLRGEVTAERRRQIISAINRCNGWV